MKFHSTLFTLLLLLPAIVFAEEATLPEKITQQKLVAEPIQFHGYDGFKFKQSSGANCKIVTPKTPAKGNPWIWRARFWDHQPALDLALLQKGYHLCYCDVAGLFGSPEAVARWDQFYPLTQTLGLHPKPILEGMSRGGLIIFNWAKANPDKVSAIYGDNPVCDIRSWPRKNSPANWKRCLAAYEITEEESNSFKGNPIDGLEPLAKAKVPLFFVLGEDDETVPIQENALLLTESYQALGGSVKTWKKPNSGHHPHGLDPVDPLLDALLKESYKQPSPSEHPVAD